MVIKIIDPTSTSLEVLAENLEAELDNKDESAEEAALAEEKALLSSGHDQLSFEQANKIRWAALEAKYKAGNRDKETVCLYVARKASTRAARGYRKHDFSLELVSIGYVAAIEAWDKYDPAKDRGNGREAYLFNVAKGYMCNAAAEMTHRLGKRAHNKGEILPRVFSHNTQRDDGLGSTGATPLRLSDVDYTDDEMSGDTLTESALVSDSDSPRELDLTVPTMTRNLGGLFDGDKSIIAAVKRAERSNGDELASWAHQTSPSAEASVARTEGAVKDAQDALLFDLLEKILSKDESELLKAHFGVLGREKETTETMAQRLGVSRSSMRRKIEAIKQSFIAQARTLNPRMVTQQLSETDSASTNDIKGAVRGRRSAPSMAAYLAKTRPFNDPKKPTP